MAANATHAEPALSNETSERASDLISVSEAVRRGYGSRATINRLIKSGRVTAYNLDGRRYLDDEELGRLRRVRQNATALNVDLLYNEVAHRVASLAPVFSYEQKRQLVSLLSEREKGGDGK